MQAGAITHKIKFGESVKRRTAIAVLLAFLLPAIGLWYFVETSFTLTNKPTLLTPQVINSSSSTRNEIANSSPAPAPPYKVAINSMELSRTENSVISAYRTAKDYRAFFDLAITRPKEGGLYLAGVSALDCSTLMAPGEKTQAQAYARQLSSLAQDAPNRAQRIEAIKTRHERCLSFDQFPLPSGASVVAMKDGATKGDSVLTMKADVSALYLPEGALQKLPQVLERAISSANPYVMEAVLMQIGAGAALFPTFINNERVPIEHVLAFGQAMSLVTCQFGMDCGPNSRPVLDLCIANNCGLNWYEVIQQNVSPREYLQIMVYHDAIVSALRTGNYAAITVQPTPVRDGLPKGK